MSCCSNHAFDIDLYQMVKYWGMWDCFDLHCGATDSLKSHLEFECTCCLKYFVIMIPTVLLVLVLSSHGIID